VTIVILLNLIILVILLYILKKWVYF